MAFRYYSALILQTEEPGLELKEFFIESAEDIKNTPIFPWFMGRNPSFRFIIPELIVKPNASLHRRFSNHIQFDKWVEEVNFAQNLMIISEPGHGKSTMLRVLYLQQIEAVKTKRSDIIPIFFDAKVLFSQEGCSLDLIFSQLPMNIVPLMHWSLLKKAKYCIFIDALDELSGSSQKALELMQSTRNLNLSFVFTSRRRYYEDFIVFNEEFSIKLSEVIELQPWDIQRDAKPFISGFLSKVSLTALIDPPMCTLIDPPMCTLMDPL